MAASFLKRWSRLKHEKTNNNGQEKTIDNNHQRSFIDEVGSENLTLASAQELHEHSPVKETSTLQQQQTAAQLEKAVLKESPSVSGAPPTMSDVETISTDGGVADFLLAGVEKSVKKAALKKLFMSSEYNVIDELDEYNQDYSNMAPLSTKVAAGLRQWLNESTEPETKVADLNATEVETEHITAPETSLDQDQAQELVQETVKKQEVAATNTLEITTQDKLAQSEEAMTHAHEGETAHVVTQTAITETSMAQTAMAKKLKSLMGPE